MQSLGYWIDTLLSRPREAAALLLAVLALGIGAIAYPDERDRLAVVVGSIALSLLVAAAGPDIGLEWHYWLGGGIVLAVGILVIDERR